MDVIIDVTGIEDCIKFINSIPNLVDDDNFKQYIGENAVKEIVEIAKTKLGTFDEYVTHNQIKILNNGVLIYNDVQNVSGEYYSLIIEYGSGTKADTEYNTGTVYWYVPQDKGPDLDRYNYKSFISKTGETIYVVYGQEPKHIYTDAANIISEKLSKWAVEYINKNLNKL